MMQQRAPSFTYHSQQSLSFGTPTQKLPSEQEQPFVPFVQDDHPSFGGGSQVISQSWINDTSSGSRQLHETRHQAYSPPRSGHRGLVRNTSSSTSYFPHASAIAANGKRTESGYDGMPTLSTGGRAPTTPSEQEADLEMGLASQSQKQQQQQQQQQQWQHHDQRQQRPQQQQQQQQQQTNSGHQLRDTAAQGMSTAMLHPSIPSYLRPYLSKKPIVSSASNVSQGILDQATQGRSEKYPSMASSLFSQSREIQTLLDKITMLDGTLDGFDRRMVDYQQRMTDAMVTKDDAMSMFESKAGEKVVETLQRQGTEVLSRLKEQAGMAQELQGQHLEEWSKNLFGELGKMTTLWQQQAGKLQEIQGEWKGELWRWKTQVQEELASEMNSLRSAIALQSHMLTMISEQNRRILEERHQMMTTPNIESDNNIQQKPGVPGGSTCVGAVYNSQDPGGYIMISDPVIDTIFHPQRPTKKSIAQKESGASSQRGERAKGKGRAQGVGSGNGRGRGRPPGKARRAELDAQLASRIDPSDERVDHPSSALERNSSKDQDIAIQSGQTQVKAASHKEISDDPQQRAGGVERPRRVVFADQPQLEDHISLSLPVMTRSRRREYDLQAPFMDLDHRERPRHANSVG